MKKGTAILSALILCICLLAGCGSKAEDTTAAAATSEAVTATEAETTAAAASTEGETASAESMDPSAADIRIGALKGPTSMGLVSMMQEHPEYYFQMETAADALTALMISGEIDIALVPANLASVLYNKTEGKISVIDINTLSVLSLVTGGDEITSIADLQGKTVCLTGKGTTPDYVLQYLLKANGLTESDVTLEYKSEATEVAALLAEQPEAIGLLPQPFATAACIQNDRLKVVLELGNEWNAAQQAEGGESALVTGVTIVRNAFLEEHPELVEAFLTEHQASAVYTNENPAQAAEWIADLGIVAKAAIAQKAIPACGITYLDGSEMKTALEGYLQVLFEQDPASIGGAMPADGFYYNAQ